MSASISEIRKFDTQCELLHDGAIRIITVRTNSIFEVKDIHFLIKLKTMTFNIAHDL